MVHEGETAVDIVAFYKSYVNSSASLATTIEGVVEDLLQPVQQNTEDIASISAEIVATKSIQRAQQDGIDLSAALIGQLSTAILSSASLMQTQIDGVKSSQASITSDVDGLQDHFASGGIVPALSATVSSLAQSYQSLLTGSSTNTDNFSKMKAYVDSTLSTNIAQISTQVSSALGSLSTSVSSQISSLQAQSATKTALSSEVSTINAFLSSMTACSLKGSAYNASSGQCAAPCLLAKWYMDADKDGYGDAATEVLSCSAPSPEFVSFSGDCDDKNADVKPGAVEKLNGFDDNCDGKGFTTDLSITGNMNLAGGMYEFTNFTIPSGVTVTVIGTTPLEVFAINTISIAGALSLSGGDGGLSRPQSLFVFGFDLVHKAILLDSRLIHSISFSRRCWIDVWRVSWWRWWRPRRLWFSMLRRLR
jgi:hypothetical protein